MPGSASGGPTAEGPGPGRAGRSLLRYSFALGVTVLAIASQYFVPELWPAAGAAYGSLAGDVAIVYGIPILSFALAVGIAPLRHARERMGSAAWEGLRWYGGMAALALVVTLALAIVYEILDPSALALLNRPNPALQAAVGDPWFFVGFSFVIGACEETIFRGWIFGFWLDRTRAWLVPALWTSALFAGVHLYYGTTYGPAAPLIFPTLFLTGFAFAAAMRFSGGNLVVIAALHGATDAAAYGSLISPDGGAVAHYAIVLAGLAVATATYLSARYRPFEPPAGWWAGAAPPLVS